MMQRQSVPLIYALGEVCGTGFLFSPLFCCPLHNSIRL